jgi:PKD repeat protein
MTVRSLRSFLARTLSALLLVAAVAPLAAQPVDTGTVQARRVHPPRPDFPQITLPDRVSKGQRAVNLLGPRLREVATWYGRSEDEFRQMLLRDRHLRLDQRGRLFVEDELEAPLPASTPAEQTVFDGTLLPLDQTFLLHSRPGAQRTIYLNFKGATLSGTAWNGSSGTLNALPFDLDGIPYSFSTAELQRIQYIWQRVAEDYAPFDVNVTTEAPPTAALTRSSNSDQVFGTTVLITRTTGVYNCSCGGVAYVGVFDNVGDFYKPALVFYDKLGSGNEKYVAEAISHEAGHNMGLGHDGTASSAYYSGHGSGATSWAPIMGVGYQRALVQWSKGQYGGANNTQDDYVLMASNGLPIRDDDHGDTVGSATALSGTAAGGVTTYLAQGVIERPTDVDMFSFVAGAGTVSVSLSPAARAANLDALVRLHDASGAVLASANPADALTATLSFTLPAAGSYHVSVQGTGKGDPLTTGYTDYGSLGNYALQVSALSAAGQAPVAVLTASPVSGSVPLTVNFSAAGSSDADGSIVAYEWTFGDGGSGSGAAVSHVYTTAGSYTAQLRVTDNTGLSATRSVTITVSPVVTVVVMRVADIAMSLQTANANRARAVATVKVVNSAGAAVSGATVSGRWSGLVSGTVSGTTNSNGLVSFNSAYTRGSGTFTFAVTGVTRSGHSYDSTLNTETSDSISR